MTNHEPTTKDSLNFSINWIKLHLHTVQSTKQIPDKMNFQIDLLLRFRYMPTNSKTLTFNDHGIIKNKYKIL